MVYHQTNPPPYPYLAHARALDPVVHGPALGRGLGLCDHDLVGDGPGPSPDRLGDYCTSPRAHGRDSRGWKHRFLHHRGHGDAGSRSAGGVDVGRRDRGLGDRLVLGGHSISKRRINWVILQQKDGNETP